MNEQIITLYPFAEKDTTQCLFCKNGRTGFVCNECSSSREQYFIRCTFCIASIYSGIHGHGYDIKVEMESSEIKDSKSEDIIETLCSEHLKLTKM